jgi:hypothetical protein
VGSISSEGKPERQEGLSMMVGMKPHIPPLASFPYPHPLIISNLANPNPNPNSNLNVP